jgi:pimeloyl-ACP methyl ester carboxylesterase
MKRSTPANDHAGKALRTVLPAAIILAGGVLALFAILVYRITHPGEVPEPVNPSHFLLPSLDVEFPSGGGGFISGWWIPGLKGAPGIVMAPGYGMSRSDGLSLAVLLHQDGFNLLTYDERGSGASPRGASSLGINETDDLIAALRFMESELEAKSTELGIWGVDVGAWAALKAATLVPEVRAIAADGVYEHIDEFIDLRLHEDVGTDNWLLRWGSLQAFRLMHIGSSMDAGFQLSALSDRSILFIEGENRPELGRPTAALYERIQPQKEMISLKAARVRLMEEEDLTAYDRQVAGFFNLNLK